MEDTSTAHLGFLISDTARLLRKRFDQRARATGLTRAQWQVLAAISRNEGINQVGLADFLEIEPITLSRHIERMEEAGLVIRRADPTDKRARLLYLSEKAHPLLQKIRALAHELLTEIVGDLPPETIEAMSAGLEYLRERLCGRDKSAGAAEAGAITSSVEDHQTIRAKHA